MVNKLHHPKVDLVNQLIHNKHFQMEVSISSYMAFIACKFIRTVLRRLYLVLWQIPQLLSHGSMENEQKDILEWVSDRCGIGG